MDNGKRASTSNAVDMLSHARALGRERRFAQSLQAFRDLTSRFPDYVDGWFERSGTENRLGNTLTALDAGARALALAPGHALHRAHLAQLQVNYGLWGDALETLSPLTLHPPGSYEARIANGIGAVMSLAGMEAEAQPWFESAARAAPEQPNYAYNQAQGLTHCGQLAESAQAFDRLIQRHPDFARAHWSRASLDAKNADERRIDMLRHALSRAGSPNDEVYYCFALFTLLDAKDRRSEAFAELEHGMNLQRTLMRYAGEDVELLRQLGGLGTALLTKGEPGHDAHDGPKPIFIVGLPRSGTTLVERILSNHPDVAQGGEFVCFSAAMREKLRIEAPGFVPTPLVDAMAREIDLPAIGHRYLELTQFKHRGHACFTDKLPFNFMLVPWIARALPDARFVHVVRDPMDTCFSNLKQLFSRHFAACYSQHDMAAYYLAYEALMREWTRLLPDRILEVKYEEIVAQPERESARLLDFCGLGARDDAWRIEQNTKPVATASAAQVRDPINARSIGAWRRYEAQLRPMAELLAGHPQRAV